MNLTTSERATMVKDLKELAAKYMTLEPWAETKKESALCKAMIKNYSALASAIKEGLTFNEVA